MNYEKNRFQFSRIVMITGWILVIMLAIGIVGTSVWMWANGNQPPQSLENWGSVVIGFLFGTFISMLREFMTDKDQDAPE